MVSINTLKAKMVNSMIDTIIIIAIIAIVVVVGIKGYKIKETLDGFFLAEKGLGPWVLAFSIMATYFSAASFLGGGGATYLYNLGFGSWLTAWHIIGVVLMWILVGERLFKFARSTGIVSISEFIEKRYESKGARIISAIVIIFLFTLYLTSVYKGGAIILATILNTSFEIGLLLLAIPVLIYITMGGLRAAAITNLILGFLMIFAAFLTFGLIMYAIGGPINGLNTLSQMKIANSIPGSLWLKFDGMGPPPAMSVGMVPLLIMSITFSISIPQIALPNLLMQFYAAKNEKVIIKGRIIGPILVALYAALMFSLGAFCHLILDDKIGSTGVMALLKDSDWVIPKTIEMIAPSGIKGIILAAPIAASMSTLSVTLLVLSAALTNDIIKPIKPNINEKKLILIARIASIIFAIISLLLTLIRTGIIVEIVGAAFGTIFACFFGPITIGLYWKKATKEGTIASMISGLIIGLLWFLFIYKSTSVPPTIAWIYPVIPALAISIPIFFIISIATRKKVLEVKK
jgi:SSS family transporter